MTTFTEEEGETALTPTAMFDAMLTSMVPSQTRQPVHQNASSSFSAVIIITYMRSGSSLTGDILQHSPGAYYLYEPLRILHHLTERPGSNLTFLDGTVRKEPLNFEEEAASILRKWLVCDVDHLPLSSLQDVFLSFGLGNKKYKTCYQKSRRKYAMNPRKAILTCLPELKTNCEHATLRIIKTIRTPLKLVSDFMEEFPGLKIIHLVRDPRPTLWSQQKAGKCSQTRFGGRYGCTDKFCKRLENDHIQFNVLSKRYPGRLKTVLYEKIAFKPIETSKEMIHFVGTTFTRETEEYVYNITLAGNPNGCGICSTRTNSSEHAVEWKTGMNPVFVKIVEDRCSYVMMQYNYTLTLT